MEKFEGQRYEEPTRRHVDASRDSLTAEFDVVG
jgi:hypothetical protein